MNYSHMRSNIKSNDVCIKKFLIKSEKKNVFKQIGFKRKSFMGSLSCWEVYVCMCICICIFRLYLEIFTLRGTILTEQVQLCIELAVGTYVWLDIWLCKN